jgi:hypothetical protein
MGTLSEAWHSAPKPIQDFYNAWSQDRMFYCNPFYDPILDPYKTYFRVGGTYFPGHRGFDIFRHNMLSQFILYGQFDPSVVVFDNSPYFLFPGDQPLRDPLHFYGYFDQFNEPEYYIDNYPRAKYRVRKSYWTGTPRRRRNR